MKEQEGVMTKHRPITEKGGFMTGRGRGKIRDEEDR